MPKKMVLQTVVIVVMVLLVPFLIGRVTVAVLEAIYPPAAPSVVRNIQGEGQAAIRSLERA